MARVKLGLEEAYSGNLPAICLRCGAPSTVFKNKMFSTGPFGLPLFILPLPGITVYTYAGKVWVRVPFCNAHKNHWLWRTLTIFISFAVLIILGLLSFACLLERPKWVSANVAGMLCPSFFIGITAWAFVSLMLRYSGVHLARHGKRTITLAGVARGFVEAVESGKMTTD
jgi:hypothetical protein